ncbi:MAG: B12-binding domain-containing radical SAM protein [bacterium]|nr:B12-binding domain-containing radical SAM protein [bacterium]
MKNTVNEKYRCLLVNPWIYDFAAFDLWSKPLGLLYAGAVLREHGCSIDLLDCMDRSDPELNIDHPKRDKKYGTGKFHKESINKPSVLADMKRYYCRYGMPEDLVRKKLQILQKPDVILLTSHMTYWYPALQDMTALLKEYFPDTPVVLGGIYAALAPENATKNIDVDYVLPGESENLLPAFLQEELGFVLSPKEYTDLDSIPYPAFDLYPSLEYLSLLTSRGCPLRCSFCASYRISGKFRQRSAEAVIEEILNFAKIFNLKDIAFYDDALLYKKEDHFIPILKSIISNGLDVNFHTPNGLQAEEIDHYTAELMKKVGFKTIRLSLETISKERSKDISKKISPESFITAVKNLEDAGFKRNEIEAYTLMGLPGQKVEEVVNTVCFAAEQGVITRPSGFSPIPGTKDWKRAVEMGDLNPDADLLETNNSIYINKAENFGEEMTSRIKEMTREINEHIRNDSPLPDLDAIKRKYIL